ncbi:MAG: hypothetical protein DDT41_01731 [candidate division WS2 bacterium]|nr:hypothetical protein [Candidatus Psychracetigena formicireducens]
MRETIKYIFGFIGIAMVLTIIFVRAGERGGMSGGEQTARIMTAGAMGASEIISAAMGGR